MIMNFMVVVWALSGQTMQGFKDAEQACKYFFSQPEPAAVFELKASEGKALWVLRECKQPYEYQAPTPDPETKYELEDEPK